ncbi:hypothetical protein TNCV_630501 [Trichonephila clavipes]|nr:hypothetical protein TNCV_630501 [Trichonephila clavipes]
MNKIRKTVGETLERLYIIGLSNCITGFVAVDDDNVCAALGRNYHRISRINDTGPSQTTGAPPYVTTVPLIELPFLKKRPRRMFDIGVQSELSTPVVQPHT